MPEISNLTTGQPTTATILVGSSASSVTVSFPVQQILDLISTATADTSAIPAGTTGQFLVTGDGPVAQWTDAIYLDEAQGQLGIGTTNPLVRLHLSQDSATVYEYFEAHDDTSPVNIMAQRVSRGTLASPTSISSGTHIGRWIGYGYNNDAYAAGGQIIMESVEGWSSAAMGSRMMLYNTPAGTTDMKARVWIEENGEIGFGTTNPSGKAHFVEENGPGYMLLDGYSGTSLAQTIFFGRAARGTVGTPVALTSGDDLVILVGQGYDGDAFVDGGYVGLEAAEAWTSVARGTRAKIAVTNIGQTSKTVAVWVEANGAVGIGTTNPNQYVPGPLTVVAGSDMAGSLLQNHHYSGSSVPVPSFAGFAARGSEASPTAISSGDDTILFQGYGHDGDGFAQSAQMIFEATEDWTSVAHGTHIKLRTVSVGETSRSERLRITADGLVGIGDFSGADPTTNLEVTGGIEADTIKRNTTDYAGIGVGTSGQVLETSGGIPTWVDQPAGGHITTLGTSGQYLQSTGGAATWVTLTDPSTGHISTLGTSGQVLQSTGSAATWVDANTLFTDPSTGHITTVGTSGQLLQSTGGAASWISLAAGELFTGNSSGEIISLGAGTSGKILQTTGGVVSWEGMSAGALLRGDSSNDIEEFIGSSGRILETTGGLPEWRTKTQFFADVVTGAGHMLYGTSVGAAIGELADPSSGAQMYYSTVDAAIGPRWAVLDAGSLMYGAGTTLAIGTSGQVLQSTAGVPTWVDADSLFTDPSTGHISTVGTSGQLLQTTGGAAAWVSLAAGELFTGNSSGEIVSLAQGSSGQLLQTTGGVLSWEDAPAGGGLPTTVGFTSGAMVRQAADNASAEYFEAGTSGQVLTIDAGLPTWATPAGGGGGSAYYSIQLNTPKNWGITDSTWYRYFGMSGISEPQTGADDLDYIIPVDSTIVSVTAYGKQVAGANTPSNEPYVFEIGINGSYTTVGDIDWSETGGGTSIASTVSLTTRAVSAGDKIHARMQLTGGTMTTNPNFAKMGMIILVKYTP